jgi:large subunit ribosomal protein L30e
MAEEQDEEEAEESVQEETKKEKKQKKVVRRRKSKKEKENQVTSAIRLVIETGKVELGVRRSIAAAADGKLKLIVVADNTPEIVKTQVRASAKTASIPILLFEGNSMELGSVCGKPFPVSVLSMFDVGTSNILTLLTK